MLPSPATLSKISNKISATPNKPGEYKKHTRYGLFLFCYEAGLKAEAKKILIYPVLFNFVSLSFFEPRPVNKLTFADFIEDKNKEFATILVYLAILLIQLKSAQKHSLLHINRL